MPSIETILSNANVLTHQWEPINGLQTLQRDEQGKIKVVTNHQALLKGWPLPLKVSVKTKEQSILLDHICDANQLAEDFLQKLSELEQDQFSDYHFKLTQYQGVINLLNKHMDYLRYCAKCLQNKETNTKNIFVKITHKNFSKTIDSKLNELEESIFALRSSQKLVAVRVHSLMGIMLDIETGALRPVTGFGLTAKKYLIGKFTVDGKEYKVHVSFPSVAECPWHLKGISPLDDAIKITAYSNYDNTLVESGHIIFKTVFYGGELNVARVGEPSNLPRLYGFDLIRERHQHPYQPYTSPTMVLLRESYSESAPMVVFKLKQALVEWAERFCYKQILAYDFAQNAVYRHGDGFECLYKEALPTDLSLQLNTHLGNKTSPSMFTAEGGPETAVPFVLQMHKLNETVFYSFSEGCTYTHAKRKRILDNKLKSLNDIRGIPFSPYRNLFRMAERRRYGLPVPKEPTLIYERKVDYRDLLSTRERCAAAQVSDDDLRMRNHAVSRKTILKVHRGK